MKTITAYDNPALNSAITKSWKRLVPLMFILYFIIAAIITTACMSMGISADVFAPLKELSKFFIIMAMAAIGLNSNVIKLILPKQAEIYYT